MSPVPVTVIIPAYNAEPFLARALRSVAAQNYEPLEVLVINDGSTDRTREIALAFQGLPLRLIDQPRNMGLSKALDAGLAAASHEWIAFLDADDEWLPNKLHRQVDHLARHPDAVMLSHASQEIDELGTVYPAQLHLEESHPPTEMWRGLLRRSLFAKPTVLARRSVMLEVGGFKVPAPVEDQDMWMRLALAGPIYWLPEDLARIHRTRTSITAGTGPMENRHALPLIARWLETLGPRLAPGEARRIWGRRVGVVGRNLLGFGVYGRGSWLVLKGAMMGYRPLESLWYLVTAAPPVRWLKRHLRG